MKFRLALFFVVLLSLFSTAVTASSGVYVDLLPNSPTVEDTLTCSVLGGSLDVDVLIYKWSLNGLLQGDDSGSGKKTLELNPTKTVIGDVWTCAVYYTNPGSYLELPIDSCNYLDSVTVVSSSDCGNGEVELGEECDGNDLNGMTCANFGYDSGSLECNSECGFDISGCYNESEEPYCGDGEINQWWESCDGGNVLGKTCQSMGYDNGSLSCTSDTCKFDTSECVVCGDGKVNQDWEECDLNDLGGMTCEKLGFDYGTLKCPTDTITCKFDTSNCGNEYPDLIADAHGNYTCSVESDVVLKGSAVGGTGIYDYAWDLDDDGQFDDSTLQNPTFSCEVVGDYPVYLRVTDSSSESADDSALVTVTGEEAYCGDGEINQWWEFCDGDDLNDMSCKDFGFTSGELKCETNINTNLVTCMFDKSDCYNESSELIADAHGDYDCAVGGTVVLEGSAIGGTGIYDYAWDLDDDGKFDDSTLQNPSFSCESIGDYNVSLRVTDSSDVSDDDSAIVSVRFIVQDFMIVPPETELDVGDTFQFTTVGGTGPVTWISTEEFCTVDNNGTITALKIGKCSIRATDVNGLTDVAYAYIGIDNGPLVLTPGDTTIFIGDTVTYYASGGVKPYVWMLTVGPSCEFVEDPVGKDYVVLRGVSEGLCKINLKDQLGLLYYTPGHEKTAFITVIPGIEEPFCGDYVVNRPSEECDGNDFLGETCQSLGYDWGDLECTSICLIDDSKCGNDDPDPFCGDNMINQPSEVCDGSDLNGKTCTDFGYAYGVLACDDVCGFDTSKCKDTPDPFCGDGVINQPSEECDSPDLGGQTCTNLGFDYGTISCTNSCVLDTSNCSDDSLDLYPTNLIVNPTQPACNDNYSISVIIVNTDSVPAFARVQFYVDGVLKGPYAIATFLLEPGQNTFTRYFNVDLSEGNHLAEIIVDGNNMVQESDETNNEISKQFTVYCTECRDQTDNDGDGYIDMLDPGCDNPDDDNECAPPQADFVYTPLAPIEGELITFTSTSTDVENDIVSYGWDFNNDGVIDETGQNANYIYNVQGTYPVTLIVHDLCGTMDFVTKTVSVSQPPYDYVSVNAGGPYTCFEGGSVNVFASATGGTGSYTFSWDLDHDGVFETAGQSAVFTCTSVGSFTITAKANDGVSSDTDDATVSVQMNPNLPPVSMPNGPYNGFTGLPVQFDGSDSFDPDGTIVSYEWNFGDGNIGFGENPSNIYLNEGSFTVTLVVTDNLGATAINTTTVTIGTLPTNACIQANYDGCEAPLEVEFIACDVGPGYSYWWTFGDGKSGNAARSIYHTYYEPGTYTATLEVTDANAYNWYGDVSIYVCDPSGPNNIPRQRMYLERVDLISETINQCDDIWMTVSITNKGSEDLEDTRIVALIDELAARVSLGPFKIKKGQTVTKTFTLDVPDCPVPGDYDIRVTVSDDNGLRRVKYRTVTVV